MNAVIFKGPYQVAVEERPIPHVQHPKDIIVRVKYTALCGSDLHLFRATEACQPGTILGHEFYGAVVEKGSEVRILEVGDMVVSPFTVSCGDCFFCQQGLSSRCTECLVFGTEQLNGAQAQFVLVPLADTTAVKAPEGLDAAKLVLMADVFPTGYFAASSALSMAQSHYFQKPQSTSVVVIVGCGPVGLCALIAASALLKPKHLVAIDTVPARLDLARSLGAEPLNLDDLGPLGVSTKIRSITDGRGADVVLELVGASAALRLGIDIIRPFGLLVSVGVHASEYPWTLNEAYGKNLRMQMGRCPVRAVFPAALKLMQENSHKLDIMKPTFMPLTKAADGYELFQAKKVQKIIFEAW